MSLFRVQLSAPDSCGGTADCDDWLIRLLSSAWPTRAAGSSGCMTSSTTSPQIREGTWQPLRQGIVLSTPPAGSVPQAGSLGRRSESGLQGGGGDGTAA